MKNAAGPEVSFDQQSQKPALKSGLQETHTNPVRVGKWPRELVYTPI